MSFGLTGAMQILLTIYFSMRIVFLIYISNLILFWKGNLKLSYMLWKNKSSYNVGWNKILICNFSIYNTWMFCPNFIVLKTARENIYVIYNQVVELINIRYLFR